MHPRLRALVRFAAALSIGIALAPAAAIAQGQPFPSRPVTLTVGFAPGGSADILARLVAAKLAPALGQPVVVENRPGAGGTIAAAAVAKAAPDGHTLLFVTSGHAGSGALYPKLAYDPQHAFVPVARVGSSPVVVVVPAGAPWRSLAELIADARARPGKISYAAGGGGATVTALAAEYLKGDAKIDLLAVPYKGSGPALIALMAGEVDLGFDIPSSALPHLRAGKLRALAVTSSVRSTVMPDVPTVAEQAIPRFELVGWFGVLAPAGTPGAVVARLNREVDALLAQPDVRERLASLAVDPGGGGPADFERLIDADTRRAGEAIRRLGIRAD
jgi:tripartite-type tricarboxylate transporter receptor subunit TctC